MDNILDEDTFALEKCVSLMAMLKTSSRNEALQSIIVSSRCLRQTHVKERSFANESTATMWQRSGEAASSKRFSGPGRPKNSAP